MSRRPASAHIGFGSILILLGICTIIGGLINWGMTTNSGESRYGGMDLPGQTTVNLPAGPIDLTFTMDLSNQTVAIPVMRMTITPIDGGPGPVVDGAMGAALSDNGVTHIRVGRAVIPHAGEYRIAADGGLSASPNPRLLIGLRHDPYPTMFTVVGIGLALLIIGIVVLVRAPVRRVPLSDAREQ